MRRPGTHLGAGDAIRTCREPTDFSGTATT
jgi:hypothetical protein